MCRRIQCDQCKKPTFAGCGAHIEQVLGDVPVADRCSCKQSQAKPTESSIFSKLFGR